MNLKINIKDIITDGILYIATMAIITLMIRAFSSEPVYYIYEIKITYSNGEQECKKELSPERSYMLDGGCIYINRTQHCSIRTITVLNKKKYEKKESANG